MTNFAHTTHFLNIAEMEYAAAPSIRFGTFTSCLGLMALDGGRITGIHMGMFTGDDMFNRQDAIDAVALIPATASQVILVGFCTQWRHDLKEAYNALTAGLQRFEKRVIDFNGRGMTVMAEIDGNRIVTSRVSY